MKTLSLLILILINTTCKENTTVYLCNSKNAKKYHFKSDCKGLSTCQHKIVKSTIDKAKNEGKTLCGWEK